MDNDDEIDNKDDAITKNKITHINDGHKLIVFDDETNPKVEIVFYNTSHKEPDEAHNAAEEANKEIDIDALINDLNRFVISTEIHITLGMVYEAPSDEI